MKKETFTHKYDVGDIVRTKIGNTVIVEEIFYKKRKNWKKWHLCYDVTAQDGWDGILTEDSKDDESIKRLATKAERDEFLKHYKG
jgi:hypothetical protein